MNNVPISDNETKRLEILRSYQILDTAPETEFDDIAQLAADLCQVDTALISFIDENRQWPKAKTSVDIAPPSKEETLCAHTILQSDVLIIKDTKEDERLVNNPAATGNPYTRFYAGVPLIVEDMAIGTLCVMGAEPHTLSEKQIRGLKTLARQAVSLLKRRKKTQQETDRQIDIYQQILDAIPDMVLVKKEKSAIYWANKAFRDYYNMSNEDLQNMIDAPFNEPDYTLQYVKDDEQVFTTGKILQISEELVTRHDGLVESFNTVKAPIFDDDNNVFLTIGVSRNIMEQKEQEAALAEKTQALEENQAFLQLVIDSLPISIFWKDDKSRFLGLNRQFAESIGLPIDEMIGKTEYELPISREEADVYVEADARVVQNKTSEVGVIQQQLNTESDVWLEVSRFPIYAEDDQVVGVLGTIDNVTTRVQSEQLLSKRAAELEILTDLSRAVTSTEALETFLPQAVNFIKDRFNLYHAHIYLTNELKDALILSAGAGEAGQVMVQEGRRIALDNPNSLVARSARTKDGVIEDDLQLAPTYLPNPLLPDSRASMAIPMIVGDEVIGVLNVQADQANYFTDEDIRIQRTLAEQIALAIQNERNRQQTTEALQELNLITRRQTSQGWEQYLTNATTKRIS